MRYHHKTWRSTCDQILLSDSDFLGASFLLYVGQVYWLHALKNAAKATNRTIFFIFSGFRVGLCLEQKYNSLRRKQINRPYLLLICPGRHSTKRLQPLTSLLSSLPSISKVPFSKHFPISSVSMNEMECQLAKSITLIPQV